MSIGDDRTPIGRELTVAGNGTSELKTITREELYEMVWAEPAVKVAARLGISDVAVAKLCKKLSVPKPPVGYWAKKEAGKDLPIPPLPELQEGGVAQIEIQQTAKADQLSDLDADKQPVWKQWAEKQQRIDKPPAGPLFKSICKSAFSKKVDDRSSHSPFRIYVCEECVGRAVALAYSIGKAMLDLGATVERSGRWGNPLLYRYLGQEFGFEFSERREQGWRVWDKSGKHYSHIWPHSTREAMKKSTDRASRILVGTGEISVSLVGIYIPGLRREWRDSSRALVESCFPEILFATLKAIHIGQRNADEQGRQERDALERKKPIALDRLRLAHLTECLEAWREVQDIRAFALDVERDIENAGDATGQKAEWLLWLQKTAASLDPVVNGRVFRTFTSDEIERKAKEYGLKDWFDSMHDK